MFDIVCWFCILSTGDGKQVAAALNRMREASILPSVEVLSEAVDLAFERRDMGLQGVLRQVAADVVGPWHQINKRLNANRVIAKPGGGTAAVMSDRWRPQVERQARRQGQSG